MDPARSKPMPTARTTGLRLLAMLSTALWMSAGLGACRTAEGGRCFCQGDCRDGLACAANGVILREGQCVTDRGIRDIEAGVCVPQGADLDDEQGLDPPRPRFDLQPDLGGLPGPGEEGGSSTSTSTGTDSGTSDTTGTQSDSTDTGTDTDTSGTSGSTSTSGTTGTTGDASTGTGSSGTGASTSSTSQ